MNQEETEHYTIIAYMHATFAGGLAGGALWVAPYLASVVVLGPPVDLIGLPIIFHAVSLVIGMSVGLFVGHYTLKIVTQQD